MLVERICLIGVINVINSFKLVMTQTHPNTQSNLPDGAYYTEDIQGTHSIVKWGRMAKETL